jgi:hypothetical protein
MRNTLFALLLLALPAISVGQTAPVEQHYIDFSGGLDTYKSSVYLDRNESPDLMNVVIDEPLGSVSQRNGYQVCGSIPSGNTATNLYEYAKNNGTRSLIVTDNTTVWQTADCSNWTVIRTGLDPYATPHFATVRDKLWMTNGTDAPSTWDGTTSTVLDGTGGLPNVPRGKWIAWWKSRVWIGNTGTSPSGVYFSALTDTSGNILDPSTSPTAWSNANNLIYFNRSDGSPLYGLKVYRDNLYAFKSTGISRLVFQSEYNLQVIKNVTDIGSKFQDSIQEMDDGLLRFIGRDGEYRFDGITVERVSTKWTSIFQQMQQPNGLASNFYSWNSISEFNQGTGVNVSTLSASAQLALYQSNTVGPNMGAELGDNTNLTNVGYDNVTTEHYYGTHSWKTNIRDTNNLYPGFTVTIKKMTGETLVSCYHSAGDSLGVWRTNSCFGVADNPGPTVQVVFHYSVNSGSNTGDITYSHVVPGVYLNWDGHYGVEVDYATMYKGAAGSNYSYLDVDESGLSSPITGSYTSQPLHAVGNSVWRTFDVNQALNGGSITYQVRTASTAAGLANAPWQAVAAGGTIPGTPQPWLQWTSAWSTTNRLDGMQVNSVTANWITGFPIKSLLTGVNYKSRYWLAASTTTGSYYNDIVMVESKSPISSHTRYDLRVSALAIWNNMLYGAISGTPKIARMDYGNTDDGAAITSWWTSRDEVYDNPLAYKSVNRLIVDYPTAPGANSLQVGLSPDFGASWQNTPVDTTIVPLARTTTNVNPAANRALQFRSRIYNNQLGKGWTVYGVHNYGSANNFLGN